MKTVHMVFLLARVAFSTTSTNSMKFRGLPVAGFTSFSAVCVNQRLITDLRSSLKYSLQIECGVKCMNTEGCLTLRYQDSVCELGGFHASRDGSESDISQCFLNEGLVYGIPFIFCQAQVQVYSWSYLVHTNSIHSVLIWFGNPPRTTHPIPNFSMPQTINQIGISKGPSRGSLRRTLKGTQRRAYLISQSLAEKWEGHALIIVIIKFRIHWHSIRRDYHPHPSLGSWLVLSQL